MGDITQGTVTLERLEGKTCIESIKSSGPWEQMYFGIDEDV